jgi:hypothetical protein
MRRRAAARLESFGFENICVYDPGKQDWLSFGLPLEGGLAKTQTAGRSALVDVPVCGQEERLAEVHNRVQETGWRECVVVTKERIVLGLLQKEMWQGDGALPVEQVMDPAPLTFRPHFTWKVVADKVQKNRRKSLW